MTSNFVRLGSPRVGDELYRVEWCKALVFDECGDVDRDQCEMAYKYFQADERDKARAFAESVWPKTQETFGIVEVDLIEFVPYDETEAASRPRVGFWECRGETEIFSGEWER